MKVTKRQLRRIIREEKARLNEQYDRDPSPGYDYDPYSDPAQRGLADMEHMQYEEYKTWAKETGQVTPAASSVMATYFVEQGLTDDAAQIGMMASGYGIDPQDVMRDIKRQQAEQSVTMGEGAELDNMPDSWRQILGTCLRADK